MGPDLACQSQGLSCPVLPVFFQNLLVGLEKEDWFIGGEAQNNLLHLNLFYPITRGTITNWDNMEKVSYSLLREGPVTPEPLPLAPREDLLMGSSSVVALSPSIVTAPEIQIRRPHFQSCLLCLLSPPPRHGAWPPTTSDSLSIR